jgi:hypothetical protein
VRRRHDTIGPHPIVLVLVVVLVLELTFRTTEDEDDDEDGYEDGDYDPHQIIFEVLRPLP